MIIIIVTDCPPALRGDLTKWLIEVNTGVYVGNVNARVREELWKRVCEHIRNGQATLVHSANNEQNMEFRVHNTVRVPIDYDGITLMLQPSEQYMKNSGSTTLTPGFSNAAKYAKIREINKARARKNAEIGYCVIDIETTGTDPTLDFIIELAAVKVIGERIEEFETLIEIPEAVPPAVTALTGITDEMLKQDGDWEEDALDDFVRFINGFRLVGHNIRFDLEFLQARLQKYGKDVLKNHYNDTLAISRDKLRGLRDHKLESVAEYFGIDTTGNHRALRDCQITKEVYNKLNEV